MARPQKAIDPKAVQGMAAMGGTDEEIALHFGCSPDTLTRRFADVLKKGRAHLRLSIRRTQVKKAMSGDNTMLIWLGKNLLSQKDKQEIEYTGDEVPDQTINITFETAKKAAE